MPIIDARTGIEIIGPEQCLRLLGSQSVGRIATVSAGRPICLPVNYALDGDRVVFRTAAGSKLDAAVRGAEVAFEVDAVDVVLQSGWSVMVAGRAEAVFDPEQVASLAELPLHPWGGGEKIHYVVIHPETVTGRRLRAPGPAV